MTHRLVIVGDSRVNAQTTSRMFGDVDNLGLESRLYFMMVLITMLAGGATIVINLATGNPMRELLYGIVVVVLGIAFHRVGARLDNPAQLAMPLMVLVSVVLALAWMTNDGSRGSTPYFFAPVLVVTCVIAQGRARIAMFAFLLLLLTGLLLLEFTAPHLVSPYVSERARDIDVAAVLITSLVICSLFALTVVQTYRDERERVAKLTEQSVIDRLKIEQVEKELEFYRDILPICAECKSIRDESGEWRSVEVYLAAATESQLSHGFCPTCANNLYGLQE